MLHTPQPVDYSESVKWTRYLLSDIEAVPDEPIFALRWLPFLRPARPTFESPAPVSAARPNLNHIPEVLGPDDPLPLEQLLLSHGESWSERVLRQLAIAENREEEAWFQTDYRIDYITVALAAQENPIPHIEATYRVLGLHPDKVWSAILARREALLGRENFYETLDTRKDLPEPGALHGVSTEEQTLGGQNAETPLRADRAQCVADLPHADLRHQGIEESGIRGNRQADHRETSEAAIASPKKPPSPISKTEERAA